MGGVREGRAGEGAGSGEGRGGEGEGGEGGRGLPNSVHAVGDEKAVAVLLASFSMRGEALSWSHPYISTAFGKLG